MDHNMTCELPKSIRQIGDMDEHIKIYIEDYVVTYLRQVMSPEAMGSRAIALFGNKKIEDENQYYFISGAVCSEKTRLEEGRPLFEEEDRTYIIRKQQEFFPTGVLLGWVLLENEFNRISEDGIWKNGTGAFAEEGKLFLRRDIAAQTEVWQLCESGMKHVISGYAIYYHRNDAMQMYLLEWHKARQDTSMEEVGDTTAQRFRSVILEKSEQKAQHRTMSLFYMASTVLMIVLCVTGITTMNHYEKMKDMETALNHLVQTMNTQTEEGKMLPSPKIEPSAVLNIQEPESAAVEENTTSMPPTQTISQGNTIYIVQDGDTLAGISKKFYHTSQEVEAICIRNHIEDPNSIMCGQKIVLP
ncbi:MAG: LysM peptidoglycan-binding domain-containing protein [Lachnospiraceae bacterium]